MGVKSFFNEFDKLQKSNPPEDVNVLLLEMKEFLKKGTYSNYKRSKELMNFWGMTSIYASKCMGLSEAAIRVKRRDLSNELYQLFGKDVFDRLRSGDRSVLKEIRTKIKILQVDKLSTDYIPMEFIEYIRSHSDVSDATYSVKECKGEIAFLVRHSINMFEKEVSSLDLNKLMFLLRLLDRKSGMADDAYNFISLLETL